MKLTKRQERIGNVGQAYKRAEAAKEAKQREVTAAKLRAIAKAGIKTVKRVIASLGREYAVFV